MENGDGLLICLWKWIAYDEIVDIGETKGLQRRDRSCGVAHMFLPAHTGARTYRHDFLPMRKGDGSFLQCNGSRVYPALQQEHPRDIEYRPNNVSVDVGTTTRMYRM